MKYPDLLDRFQRYVQIDTQSDPHSPTVPSTEKQKDLGRVLVEELLAIGVSDAETLTAKRSVGPAQLCSEHRAGRVNIL